MASTLENADGKTKAEVAEMEKAVVEKAKGMAGVTAPLGLFDPLGFTTSSSEGKLLFYREVEIKHGRVAMLASLGFLVGEQFHPLFGGDIDVPSLVAFQATPLQNFWQALGPNHIHVAGTVTIGQTEDEEPVVTPAPLA